MSRLAPYKDGQLSQEQKDFRDAVLRSRKNLDGPFETWMQRSVFVFQDVPFSLQ